MTRPSQVAAGVFALLGVFATVESLKLPYYTADGPGPGFFPLWIGIALTAVSTAHLIQLMVKRPHSALHHETTIQWAEHQAAEHLLSAEAIAAPDGEKTWDEVDDDAPSAPTWPDRAGAVRVAVVVCAVLYVALTLPWLGFPLSMFTMLVVVLRTLGRQRLWVTVAVAAVGSVGVYYVFAHWLQVQLPPTPIPGLSQIGL